MEDKSIVELYKRNGKIIENEERLVYYLDNWEKTFFRK